MRSKRQIIVRVLRTAGILRKAGMGLAGFLLLTPLLQGSAASPFPAEEPYVIRNWQAEDGLPQNTITALVQTRSGYIWIGTYSGLARFDGVRFTVFDPRNTPAIRTSGITSLCEADDGTLWIGHSQGEVTRWTSGRFEAVSLPAGTPPGKVLRLQQDGSGDVWGLIEPGLLVRYRDGLILTPPAGSGPGIRLMQRAADGAMWVVRDGRISRVLNGRVTSMPATAVASSRYVHGLGVSGSRVWVASDGQLHQLELSGQLTGVSLASPWGTSPTEELFETAEGDLIAATANNGLYVVPLENPTNRLHFGRRSGFPTDWATSTIQDREGGIWVGTGGAGLFALRQRRVHTLTPPDAWQGRAVLGICAARDGSLWIGTEGAGVYHYASGEWQKFGNAQGIHLYAWSLNQDRAGAIWLGTWGGGLFCRENEVFERVEIPGARDIAFPALASGLRGDMWVGTDNGLIQLHGNESRFFGMEAGSRLAMVRSLAIEPNGTVWFGTAGTGLGRLANGQIRTFTRADGLSGDHIQALYIDKSRTLWIGTAGAGLNQYREGKFSAIDKTRGLPDDTICHITEDGLGNFWMSSYNGLIRVRAADLNDCASGKIDRITCSTYGSSDGMPTIRASSGMTPSGARTSDGKLWFPTGKGLVYVDPARVEVNTNVPPVVIETILVDDRPQPIPVAGAVMELKPGRRRFAFEYAGLSFAAPERVQFRYRLEGLEQEWVEAGTRRSAHYSYLPPGRYRFLVTACNNDGIWNQTGTGLDFVLLPFFWQTLWFRLALLGALVLGTAGGVWIVARRRLRRKLELLQMQHAVETERSRIAQDIHDDLGSHLTRITMLSESARSDPARTTGSLQDIYNTARELTRAMDEIVWAVNPRHDTLEGLTSYLEKFAIDFLRTAGMRCRLDLPISLPAWELTAETRHNLFLAFKEALNNAAKHSHGTAVTITLQLQTNGFTVVVSDDGRGLTAGETPAPDPAGGRLAGGDGMANMRRRMQKIGGSFAVHSEPGKGTRVELSLPVISALPEAVS